MRVFAIATGNTIMSSGAVLDKATAAWHSVAGSSINKIVCKASSRELAGPKKKHVDGECVGLAARDYVSRHPDVLNNARFVTGSTNRGLFFFAVAT